MEAYDFGGKHEINNLEELRTILLKRYEKHYNGIWLIDDKLDKALSVLVKDNLSYVHYFPESEDNPGFHSVGGRAVEPEGGETIFRMETVMQEQEIMNEAVVSFADAMAAAEQFFARILRSCLKRSRGKNCDRRQLARNRIASWRG